jgi:hypothetical protein
MTTSSGPPAMTFDLDGPLICTIYQRAARRAAAV